MRCGLCLLLICCGVLVQAQVKPKTPTKPKVTKPAPARNELFNSIKNVIAVANNADQKAFALTASLAPGTYEKNEMFTPTLQPADVIVILQRGESYIANANIAVPWKWIATRTLSLGEDPKKIADVKNDLDKLLSASYSRRDTSSWLGGATIIKTELTPVSEFIVTVSFNKPLEQSVEATAEELNLKMKARLDATNDMQTIVNDAKKHIEILKSNLYHTYEVEKAFTRIYPAIANKNIRAAFEIVLDVPYYMDMKKLVATLSESQKAEIQRLAKEVVDNFNKKKEPQKTEPPVGTNNASDDADFKKFMESFPKLSLPYTLTPQKLVGSKHISKLPWTKKIFSVVPDNLYAVGLIQDCGRTKALLVVQATGRDYDRSYIFNVLEIRNGYFSKQTLFTNGLFYESGGVFCGSCSLSISSDGTTVVSTIQNGRTITSAAKGCW